MAEAENGLGSLRKFVRDKWAKVADNIATEIEIAFPDEPIVQHLLDSEGWSEELFDGMWADLKKRCPAGPHYETSWAPVYFCCLMLAAVRAGDISMEAEVEETVTIKEGEDDSDVESKTLARLSLNYHHGEGNETFFVFASDKGAPYVVHVNITAKD